MQQKHSRARQYFARASIYTSLKCFREIFVIFLFTADNRIEFFAVHSVRSLIVKHDSRTEQNLDKLYGFYEV